MNFRWSLSDARRNYFPAMVFLLGVGCSQLHHAPEPVRVARSTKEGRSYYESGRDALLTCVIVNDTKNLRHLLAEDPDINTPMLGSESRWSFLHFAALHAHPEVVELLLEHGADVRAKTPAGVTALSIAQDGAQGKNGEELIERSRKVIQVLKRYGAK
jgi:hypothetical protein